MQSDLKCFSVILNKTDPTSDQNADYALTYDVWNSISHLFIVSICKLLTRSLQNKHQVIANNNVQIHPFVRTKRLVWNAAGIFVTYQQWRNCFTVLNGKVCCLCCHSSPSCISSPTKCPKMSSRLFHIWYCEKYCKSWQISRYLIMSNIGPDRYIGLLIFLANIDQLLTYKYWRILGLHN